MASRRASGPGAAARSWACGSGPRSTTRSWSGCTAAFADPRDPAGEATLGRAPSGFAGNNDKVAALIAARLAAEPEATPERRDQLIMQALKDQRAAVYFFDATFSVPKSVSLLHASLQVRAQQARDAGLDEEAEDWAALAETVWDGIMAGNQAMLDYLQREAGYSRAGYHSKGSGRFADAHEWVVASFRQHTSRDNDPQLHVHNAILNRVLRDDPLASRPGDRRAWRTLDGAALYAAKPAAGAIAERTLAEYLADRLGVAAVARPDGNGWEIAGISEQLRDQFSSRRRAIGPRVQQLIDEYERKHGKAPNARALWSMAQFVTLDSRRAKAHSAPSRDALLAQWEAQSRRAETEALSAIPDAALGRRAPEAEAGPPSGADVDLVLAAAVADVQRGKATFSRYELTRMINRYLPDFLGGLTGAQVTSLLDELTDGGAAARWPGRGGAADRAGDGAGAGCLPARGRAEPVAPARRGDLHHPRHARHRSAAAARRGANRRTEARAGTRRRRTVRRPGAGGGAAVARARPRRRTGRRG